jgi:hypothetical protein
VDLGRGGRRLNAEQLVEPGTLIAITEPGFDDTVDRERNRNGHKEHEQVLLEEAAKTLPNLHARTPQFDTDGTEQNDPNL